MRALRRSLPLTLIAMTLTGCASSVDPLAALSASGSIQQDAPVRAHEQIDIAAPPDRVWAILIDAPSWPHWATQIDSVESPGPLIIGTRFTWHSGGTTIHSEVHLLDPQHSLSWTSTALTAKAVHVWKLQPSTKGTLVTVDESMSGPMMSWLYTSSKLSKSDRSWLLALKQAAERHP
jgi:uncharacterized membrane protein